MAPGSAARMSTAAGEFLAALDADQRALAAIPFGDTAARQDWHYVPRRRGGISFRELTAGQEQLAYRLLAVGLSLPALAAATTIIGLEDVLDVIERQRYGRHRADFSVTVFDSPGGAVWGWRFEGHHVSVNVTVVADEITATPLFFGSNPARVDAASGVPVVRALGAEEDLAVALVQTLAVSQRNEALLAHEAPADILTRNAPTLEDLPAAAGVRLAELRGSARTAADSLVRHYLDRLPGEIADAWWQRLQADLGDVRFAIAGDDDSWSPERSTRQGRPQYYRLAGPSLLVEYDNTQNGANHVHTVLRDPGADFGVDLLRRHRAEHH